MQEIQPAYAVYNKIEVGDELKLSGKIYATEYETAAGIVGVDIKLSLAILFAKTNRTIYCYYDRDNRPHQIGYFATIDHVEVLNDSTKIYFKNGSFKHMIYDRMGI